MGQSTGRSTVSQSGRPGRERESPADAQPVHRHRYGSDPGTERWRTADDQWQSLTLRADSLEFWATIDRNWGASVLFAVNKLVIRHTSGGPYRFDSQAAPALMAYVNSSALPMEATIRKATEQIVWDGKDLPSLHEYLARVAKFSKPEVNQAIAFAKAEEGDCRTLWQLVQGFTAYARGFDYVDARVDLETRAGKLLNLATVAA